MNDINGRVALVTGGARRIGAAIVRELHARDMHVIIHYRRSRASADTLADELNALRADSATTVQADLGESGASEALVAAAKEHYGGLDVLVNNASVFPRTRLADLSREQWSAVLEVNVTLPLFLAQATEPLLAEREGAIINLGDAYAARLPLGYGAYAATKAALADLTCSLARELAPRVRVNAVAPGAVLWPEPEPDETTKQKMLAGIPLMRLGEPADIARAAAFLATEPYLTGVILPVDGGRSLA